MQELNTQHAEDFTGNPAPETVCLFQSVRWSSPGHSGNDPSDMLPGFAAGGFPLPQHRLGRMLIVEAGKALPPCGGYMEETGRNRYIDGCSSSLLVMPPSRGDPCVNHLHIVAGTVQTEHHHPSDRVGMVVRGYGLACHEAGPPLRLRPGLAWRLPAGERHHFETFDRALDVLVFHPDSAWGPTDEAHQMLDATIL